MSHHHWSNTLFAITCLPALLTGCVEEDTRSSPGADDLSEEVNPESEDVFVGPVLAEPVPFCGTYATDGAIRCGTLEAGEILFDPDESSFVPRSLTDGPFCLFFVDSNLRGSTLIVPAPFDINDIHDFSFGDKISSLTCSSGVSLTIWKDKNWKGEKKTVTGTVLTLHITTFGTLGDNISSISFAIPPIDFTR